MIKSIDELIDYTQRMRATKAHLQPDILIRRPGLADTECRRMLRHFARMPRSYVSVLRELDISGVSIGCFRLSPAWRSGAGLVTDLIECNSEEHNPMVPTYRDHGVFEVAACEALPIGVAATDSRLFSPGDVLMYDLDDLDASPQLLARTFTQLLLLAGSLDEVRDSLPTLGDRANALPLFRQAALALLPGEHVDVLRSWDAIAEVILKP